MSRPFGLDIGVASVLAQLFCFNKTIAQGAPSSPIISNWVCRSLDRSLVALSRSVGCTYGRYADDITFSGHKAIPPSALVQNHSGNSVVLAKPLLDAISEAGFAVNQQKVWIRTSKQRQEVTGLVVNEKVNTRRTYYRNIRAALHAWRIKGYETANQTLLAEYLTRYRNYSSRCLANWLRGKIAYFRSVRGDHDAIGALLDADFRLLRTRDFGAELRAVAVYPKSSKADRRAINGALWLVLVKSSTGEEISQGTAFAVADHQLVTSAHVVEEASGPGATIEVRRADAPSQAYSAHVAQLAHAPADLALLETTAPIPLKLRLGSTIPDVHSRVTVAGFSNWNAVADAHRIVDSEVVQIQYRSLIHRISVHAPLSEGMSGGPMLQKGYVVGVITDAHDSPRLVNAAVSAIHAAEILHI